MLLLVWCVLACIAPLLAKSCERAPLHAQPADTFYKLGVAGDPDLFLPGELYTVSLQGIDSGQGPTPFIGFVIWAELEEENENKTESPNLHQLGAFQAYDAQAKLYEACEPAVTNATSHPKTEIQVLWTAPSGTADLCVRLCVRATQANAAAPTVLARKLCPAPIATLSLPRQPPIVEPCCACDEAKYEVTFEGMWSRNTHPREFPPESARAHFGDVIGASHTAQYRVWQEGRVASAGLRRLADDGMTTALEKELKAESDHIRTIIKARGISWQQIAGAGTPSTFAVFRVDAKHHLMSLAAKLAPSPDWIVGVSALELCNANCTWRRAATLPLYPYDAGTDSGITYTSRRQPSIPAAPVRALRPDWPRDARSPFYGAGEMRPFARLRLNRLRLYEKSCDASESAGETVGEGSACAVHAWGAWGPCSVSCGAGRAARQRHYVWPARARADACRLQLTEYRACRGPRMHCRVQSEYEPEPAVSAGPCALSAWSEWSPCEGCGVRARTRHYLRPRAHKRCSRGYRARTVMSQARPCDAGPCFKPPDDFANATNFDWFYIDNPRGSCPTGPWGEWSACAARCGRGRRLRTRLLLAPAPRTQHALTRRLLATWNKIFAQLQGLEVADVNATHDEPEVEALVEQHLELCQFTLTQQEALCDGDDPDCANDTVSSDDCSMPVSVGHCRGYDERWFYDVEWRVCEPFGYTGCGGNKNNYKSREACEAACGHNHTYSAAETTESAEPTAKRMKATPSSADNEVMQNDGPIEQADCETGPWLGWSECFGSCDVAVKLNYRLILRPATGGGRACHKVVKSRSCRPAHCKRSNTTDTHHDD
ncbi:spondin-1-like [Aricia agestis]|uniref:spondin-1-like n=1 Tax=Aricia agestis TaxID=91739 RepID=UPI001C205DF0|nr:spondin-1-like [Aricia agestis]XP_041972856.1 spondin-1-like [Aricia agestis]XP_041972857.1 spondin-1-like [Aricia agestis]